MGKTSHFLALVGFVVLLLGCAGSSRTRTGSDAEDFPPPPGEFVLRVTVKDVAYTDWYPACAEADDCVPVKFWYKYRARVKQVISGSWSSSEIEFIHLQHGEYLKDILRDCYVVLRPASPDLQSKIGVQFEVDELLEHCKLPDGMELNGGRSRS